MFPAHCSWLCLFRAEVNDRAKSELVCLFLFAVLDKKPKAFSVLNKNSTSELSPAPP